jgi:type IV secretion system protein VirD4
MISKENKKRLKIGGCAILFVVLMCVANYLAGALLFLSFKEDPTKADFLTIEHAYLAEPSPKMMKRIKICALLSIFVSVLGPFGLMMRIRPKGSNLYGKSGFANMDEIRQEKLDAKKGLVLGKFKDELLRLGGFEFVLLAAPTRTGKGVGFCVPNLLQFEDSAVVLDIKGENYNLTSEFRRRYMGNEIIYFNPFSENTKRWNPLSYVSKNPSFRANDLMAIAAIIYPVNEKDPFWSDAAKNLFVGLGLLVLETPELPKTIGEILRQGSGKGNPIDVYINHILTVRAASTNPLSNNCRDSLSRFLGSGETALKGILATFSAALTPFANDVVDKATSGDDFDLRDVRKKKMTIYLNIPAGEILQAAFITNLFFSQLINENVKELPEQNPDLKYQCLLLLDEFTAMGKVSIIAKGVGYMAGYNMRLAIIIQDKTQLDSVYGKEDAHNIVSNMGAVIYFTPSQVSEAEEYSKMIGNNTVLSDSVQHARGTMFGLKGTSGDSSTESFQSRAVMLPQELLRMSKDSQLVVRSGIPVIQAGKIRYYEDAYFKERFNAVPMQEVSIGTDKRKVPIPAKLPVGDWDAYRAALRTSDYYVNQKAPDAAKTPSAAGAAGAADSDKPGIDQKTAIAQAADAAREAYRLPALPADFEPFYELYLRLQFPVKEIMPVSHTAVAYAESIAHYWEKAQQSASLGEEATLVILDLTPGDGRFSWQLLNSLVRRETANATLVPALRYVACANGEAEQAALQAHAHFSTFTEQGTFSVITQEELYSREPACFDGSLVVAIAHGMFSSQHQEMIAVHYGEMFQVHAKPIGTPEPTDKELRLDYNWPAVLPEAFTPAVMSIVEMYRKEMSSAVVLLPVAAVASIDRLSTLAGGRFLMLSADPAVIDEREIRLGAFSPPTLMPLPSPGLSTNYHAIGHYLKTLGAEVWMEQVPDSTLSICAALCGEDRIDAKATLDVIRAPLSMAHANDNLRLATMARAAGLNLTDCLSMLQRASFDPAIFSEFFGFLSGANWNISAASKEYWRQALDNIYHFYLPATADHALCGKIGAIAARLGHYGLARRAASAALGYEADSFGDIMLLAEIEMQTGHLEESLAYALQLTALKPDDATAASLRSKIESRIAACGNLSWYRSDLAQSGDLTLEPIAEDHAEQLLYQYRDPQIGTMSMLPALGKIEDARRWIAGEIKNQRQAGCAIVHRDWGVVGYVGLQRSLTEAYFSFWIGTDHQGHGYGVLAANAMLGMLRESGLSNAYTACFRDNTRALGALHTIGFHELDILAMQPYADLDFLHLGQEISEEEAQQALAKLCSALSIPFEFTQPERYAA